MDRCPVRVPFSTPTHPDEYYPSIPSNTSTTVPIMASVSSQGSGDGDDGHSPRHRPRRSFASFVFDTLYGWLFTPSGGMSLEELQRQHPVVESSSSVGTTEDSEYEDEYQYAAYAHTEPIQTSEYDPRIDRDEIIDDKYEVLRTTFDNITTTMDEDVE